MKVLYVRHGKSTANTSGIVGTPDVQLAEEGIGQAHALGQDLRNHEVTNIVCSPFIRAQQTAEIIAGELGILVEHIEVIDELHERRMGELEGKPKQQDTAYFYENDAEKGFESHAELIARMQVAVDKVKEVAERAKGTIVMVGHATSGFYFLQVAKGKTRFEDFDPINQMSNTEFIEVEFA